MLKVVHEAPAAARATLLEGPLHALQAHAAVFLRRAHMDRCILIGRTSMFLYFYMYREKTRTDGLRRGRALCLPRVTATGHDVGGDIWARHLELFGRTGRHPTGLALDYATGKAFAGRRSTPWPRPCCTSASRRATSPPSRRSRCGARGPPSPRWRAWTRRRAA